MPKYLLLASTKCPNSLGECIAFILEGSFIEKPPLQAVAFSVVGALKVTECKEKGSHLPCNRTVNSLAHSFHQSICNKSIWFFSGLDT